MPNFKAEISRHNQKVLKTQREEICQVVQEPGCNCRAGPCPLDTGNCQVDHVIYKASIKDEDNKTETYTGLTQNTFKTRYNAHKHSFNHRGQNSTTRILISAGK